MRRLPALCLVACLLGLLLSGASRADSDANAKLNQKIDNIPFKDGKATVKLHDLKDKKAVVVVFLSFECPVSTSYLDTLANMAREYGKKDVAFLGVTGYDDDKIDVVKQSQSFKLPFPLYKDDGNAAADALKADTMPEVFILDHNFVLRYRGRIDNGYTDRFKRAALITKNDLKTALDELLSGKDVSEPVTKAVGCAIKRDQKIASTGKVTYYRDVLPILQTHCQGCHRPGEVGPFSLMNYRQAVNWATDIKEYTQSRRMPPWKPIAGPEFYNERKLSDKDIATLAAWADGGKAEGDPKDAPEPPKFTDGWRLGEPDLILKVEDDFHLGAGGRDVFRVFVLPTGLTEDRSVVAVDVRPGNPRIVHHVLNFVDSTGAGRKLEKAEKERTKKEDETEHGPGYSVAMGVGFTPQGGLSGWAPGQVPRVLPDNGAFLLPKGSDLVMQVHYHRNGRAEKDRTQVGLYFAKKDQTTKRYQGMVIAGGRGLGGLPFFSIPAGKEDFTLKGAIRVDTECDLHSVMPHMHMVGKAIKVTMTPPDGKPETLVDIKDWDYNWQETYFFKAPIKLKEGTILAVEAVYDNSAKNPNNPNNPPKVVTFGEQTTNEMCFVFLGATSDNGRVRFTRGVDPEKAKKEEKK